MTVDLYLSPVASVMNRAMCLPVALVILAVLHTSIAVSQTSPHGDLNIACMRCHTTTSWTTVRSPMLFDHDSTGFALRDQHKSVPCDQCHKNLVFAKTSTRCQSCHQDVHRGELGALCERCHNTQSWLVPDMRQRHSQTRFTLLGAHMTAPCQACHTNEQKFEFVNIPVDCYGCHRSDYDATSAPPHRASGLGTNCIECHSPNALAWPANFDHASTGFALVGVHASTPCVQCHTGGGAFKKVSTQCDICHHAAFMAATNPNHVAGHFSSNCQTCHNSVSWQTGTFDHASAGFPLTGGHAAPKCDDCHKGNYNATSTACVTCHQPDYSAAKNPPHTGFSTDCTSCHTIQAWQPAQFDHSKSSFPLTGAHASVPCATCHVNNNFVSVSTACVGCHQQDFTNASTPPHSSGGFSTDCTTCHNTTAWQPSVFNHSTTRFPLTGAHTTVTPCTKCHTVSPWSAQATACVNCHQADFTAANNPPHTGFATDCTTCHTTTAWQPASFDHSKSAFPLTGAHASVPCASCHANNNFASTPTTCVGCHQQNFNTASNPPHSTGGFSTDCTTCHNTTAWQPSTFNHSTTKFPLTGAHATVTPCTSCHKVTPWSAQSVACVNCHQADFTAANNPPHTGFSTDCTTCHTTTAWQPASFDHSKSSFPLTGAHVSVPCASCHVNNNFTSVPTTCVGCHQQNFNTASNPPHSSGGFSTDCTTCHTTTAWQPSTFNHSTTKFPLTGAHATVTPCTSCHTVSPWSAQSTACVNCHQADFTAANNPPHTGFPTDCTTCHTTTAWQPASFDHSKTSFPLTGAHVSVACASCHVNNNFTTVPTTCVGCHQQNFTTAANPPHSTGGFSTDCTTCHNTTAWQPSTFNHSTTRFPLTGAHATVTPCAACHTVSPWSAQSTACISCHQADFNATNNPPHTGFPTDCTTCHTTTAWQPASFDHSKTTFPLTGAHVSVPCASCHVNNNFTTLPTACVGCHQTDFNGTTNPPHSSGGFSTDCTTCHNTTAWQPSTFNHSNTKFPLTGAHTTVTPCTACHTVSPWSSQSTACVSCHQTDYNSTTNPNHASAGFPTTCQTCHTTTAWTGATFNHTWFPLTHGNSGGVCATCHTNPSDYSVFTCMSGNCHPQAQTNSNHNGISGYQYVASACYSCHPRGSGG